MTSTEVVLEFIGAVNARHMDKIVGLMTPDHHFTDSLGNVIPTRRAMRDAWSGYFENVPDYHIEVEKSFADGDVVVVVGTATGTCAVGRCKEPQRRFKIFGAWRALVVDGRIGRWQVYADNEPLRKALAP